MASAAETAAAGVAKCACLLGNAEGESVAMFLEREG